MADEDRAFELFSEMQELPTPLIFATTMMLIEEICKGVDIVRQSFKKSVLKLKKRQRLML